MNNTDKNITKDFLLLGGFIEYLSQNGFEFGTDQFLRVKQLLNALDAAVSKEQLKYILCPLFATNPEKQEQFYYFFDRYFDNVLTTDVQEDFVVEAVEEEVLHQKPNSFKYITRSIGAFTLLGLLLFLISPESTPDTQNSKNVSQIQPDTVLSITDIDTSQTGLSLDTIQAIVERPINDVNPNEEIPIPIEFQPTIEEDVTDLIYQPTWWEKYGLYVQLSLILLMAIAAIAYHFFREQNRKYLLLQQQFKKPPDTNPLEIPRPKFRLFQSDAFFSAAKTLRERDISDHVEINVDKTIDSTIEAGGMLQLEMTSLTKPSEYLVLVDIKNKKNHLGNWLKQLALDLQKQDVIFEVYYYHTDPRIVWRYQREDWYYLEDLFFQFRKNRLILFGDGEFLQDAFTGQLREWTQLIEDWEDRFICTPIPINEWTRREANLETLLTVLPATPEGVTFLNIALNQRFLQANPIKRLKKVKQFGWNLVLPDFNIDLSNEVEVDNLLRELAEVLTPEVFEWLCTCAVYPELHWDFTLELGRRLQQGKETLINAINTYQLSMIPWFQEGRIPNEIQQRLNQQLDPFRRKLVLKTVVDVLNLNPPAENTYAYNQYQMHLALAEMELTEEKKEQRKLRRKIRDLAFADPEAKEIVTLKYGNDSKQSASLAFLKNTVYKEGMQILGISQAFRNFVLTSGILLSLLIIFLRHQIRPIVTYKNQQFLLETAMDSTRFFIYKGLQEDSLQNRIASFDQALALQVDFAKAHYNQAFQYWEMDKDSLIIQQTIKGFSEAQIIADTAFYNPLQFHQEANQALIYQDSLVASSRFNLGAIYYELKNYQQAKTQFTELIQRDSMGLFEYQRGLSQLYMEEAQVDSALMDFTTVWNKDSNFYKMDYDSQFHPIVEPLLIRYKNTSNLEISFLIKTFFSKLDNRLMDYLQIEATFPEPLRDTPQTRGNTNNATTRDTIRVAGTTGQNPNPVIPPKPTYKLQNRNLIEGLAAIKNQDGLWGFMNAKGELIIDFQFEEVTDFINGNAQVVKGDNAYYINKQGRCILDCPQNNN